ncbi:MAG: D-glycerate dehydrogenase [candidate division NC10 bacterium]|jgi:lactate dehydrogenase-like 2-hydroxyacid dehydrogenase|nr:D-glycerate dehydrogenase [candidate division NC10 bacterium]
MSTKPKIVVTRKLPQAVEDRLRRHYDPCFNEQDRLYTSDELIQRAAGADALLICHTEHLSAAVIARLPDSIRAIANFSVGVDHVDLAAAKARGITVTNTPDVLSDATAELTILLMLGAARRASEGERLVRTGEWNTWSPSFMVGIQVTGKRLGIIGMGRVGHVTARRARGFDMEIHYSDVRRLPSDREAGAIYHETTEDLLPHCDFLALHCPATPETRHLLNAERIALLPDGAIVVNAARGSIVDETALIDALKSGKLAAAGLDVYENEPSINPAFRDIRNTFLLPHIGSATRETRDAMGFRALDNLDAIFAGREPRDRVA